MTMLREEIIALRKEGQSYNEIRSELGCSITYIYLTLRDAGITRPRAKVLAETREKRVRKIQARLKKRREEEEIEERAEELRRQGRSRLFAKRRRNAS